MFPRGGTVVAFVEEYWPWVGGICKCLGYPWGQPPGMAADKCINSANKLNRAQLRFALLFF